MSILAIFIQHSFASLRYSNQRRKRNKRNPCWKRSKTVTIADDMILYIQNPKDAIRILLELNEFSKVARYKVKTQKSAAILYTLTTKDQTEKLNNSIYHCIKKHKVPKINLKRQKTCTLKTVRH